MNIYLLRHAIAVPRGTPGFPNDDRPLTDEGRKKMIAAAKAFIKVIDTVDVILTSPLVRASETAQIAATALHCEEKVMICDKLQPEYSAKFFIEYLAGFNAYKNIMLVGHEPQMGLISSNLLGCEKGILEVKKGSLICIEIESLKPRTVGKLLWSLRPKHLRMIA